MKYIPLNNFPNVSRTRAESFSPSFKLDSNSYPHVTWLEKQIGINSFNYSYWDGEKWAYYETPHVYVSKRELITSPNAIVLDNSPIVTFARKTGDGERLYVARYNDQWVFSEYDIDFEVNWIGIVKAYGDSSSSLSSGTSEYYVVVYDETNSAFKIYDEFWNLVGEQDALPGSSVKIDSYGSLIGIAFIDGNLNIQYNFFNISGSWEFLDFQVLGYSETYDNVQDMDFVSYDESLAIGWLSRQDDYFYVCHGMVDRGGMETPTGGSDVVVERNTVNVETDYVVNGYRKIGVERDSIFAGGTCSKYFWLSYGSSSSSGLSSSISSSFYGSWESSWVDIEAVADGLGFEEMLFSDEVVVLKSDSDIYCLLRSGTSSGFSISKPKVVLLNDEWVRSSVFANGMMYGYDVSGTYDSNCAGFLIDGVMPGLVVDSMEIVPTTTTTTTTAPNSSSSSSSSSSSQS